MKALGDVWVLDGAARTLRMDPSMQAPEEDPVAVLKRYRFELQDAILRYKGPLHPVSLGVGCKV